MSERRTIPPADKITVAEQYLAGKTTQTSAAKKYQVHIRTIQSWIRLYEAEGPTAFQKHGKTRYSADQKLHAVKDYLDHQGSLDTICTKYGIRAHEVLAGWVKMYNEGKPLRDFTGGTSMKKAKKTSSQERLEIVKDCLVRGRNYGETARKYGCSYQQVRNWVQKYETMGEAGLEDRRGKRTGSLPPRTREEEWEARIAQLEREKKALQMENDLLKKLKEIERRDGFL